MGKPTITGDFRELTTKEKALKINLDPRFYGSFAEIGAGQETAEFFFKAGGASGTIAKTMSAYDMKFSDVIYGKAKRYVSQERLVTMMEHEYSLLPERLEHRAETTCFFALSNTVETLNYHKTNRGHGWLGVRFQLEPNSPPNNVILHVVLKDNESLWQQEAIGIIGVNLLYGCFYLPHDTEQILHTLLDGLSTDRAEIDMIRFDGPNFHWVDNRLLALKLVSFGLTRAAMFGSDGNVLHPSEFLYKKNVLILRGRFRPPTKVNVDMLREGYREFLEEPGVVPEEVVILSELTLSNLTSEGKIDDKDFLDRVDILGSMGHTVMISNYHQYYKLIPYLTQFTQKKKIGIVLGVYNLEQIFDEQYYTDLRGGILEAFGVLFGSNVKVFVYPAYKEGHRGLYTCDTFQLRESLQHLFHYLIATNKIEDLPVVDRHLLHITSDKVLAMIQQNEPGWEEMVPAEVAAAVQENGLFGFGKVTKIRE
ncbi:MAG: TonB-dependent receptor [Bacteroidia bacterium]|nr:TonB-dependent receptor [Bacteroidia bacterium]